MAQTKRVYRLLIVDDDELDRRNYGRLLDLQAPGRAEIEHSDDGATGLATLFGRSFDCVLLDINLPDMNGLKFLTLAATDGALPCAVVVVTGSGNELIAVEAMKLGAQDYLVKDQLDQGSLWRAITQAVNERELHQRLAGMLRDLTAANTALEAEALTRSAAEAALRATKEAAEEASRAKTRFVAMVTHELRTPLNGILGYAQLLRIEGGLSGQQDGRVGAMMTAGRHLLDMIERVLDFASIESGRMELHPATISVRDLAEGCIAFIGPIATEHALGLRLTSSHDSPRQIVADPSRLRQVLLNLLGNAVKYTETGGIELRMLAGAAPGSLRIEVVDTGRGISEEAGKRLFQDFERLEAAASVEGTGLGLAISARIVGLMGGKIGYMAPPGGGSLFWLELPSAAVEAPSPPAAAPEAPPPVQPIAAIRVLVVDDIAMNRDVVGAFLRAAGHEVALAEGGHEAVRLAFEQKFDLILMDVRMPEMDGLEATRRIRKLAPPQGRVPILALTANSFPEQVAQSLDAGMDGHVAKPVDYDTLMEAIAATLAHAPTSWIEHFPPASAPPTEPSESVEASPPRFDRAALNQTLDFLWPDQIGSSLRLLRTRKEYMLQLLDQRADPAKLADNAHALASAAGMFGFAALSAAGRRFERAVALDLPEVEFLTQQLRVETSAALTTLDELLREERMQQA